MGGGLGGGSSDAATTLVVLNTLWQCGLDEDQLAEIGLGLGADVPVFVRGYAAFAEGVGEQLQPVEPQQPWYLIVKPEVHISTAEIFANSQLTRDSSAIKICDLQIGTAEEADVFEKLGNVFQPVVAQHYPEIAEVIATLSKYAKARLTGTGACVFAAFATQDEALQAMQQLPDDWSAFVAKGLNRSPLQAKLASVSETTE